jgi:hypothetical protein
MYVPQLGGSAGRGMTTHCLYDVGQIGTRLPYDVEVGQRSVSQGGSEVGSRRA